MDKEKAKGIIEAILFASARVVQMRELSSILELDPDSINKIISEMMLDYANDNRGIEIVKVEDGFQLSSKKKYHEYIYPAIDKRIKPTLSRSSLEVLAIIAYNRRVTKSDIDTIRGVDSAGSIYRLQEYDLIEQAGKADLPGKPMTYRVTNEFLKMFGLKSLNELPKLPKYKLDSNRQIVIEDLDDEAPEPAEGEGENNKNEEEIDLPKVDKTSNLVNDDNVEDFLMKNIDENDKESKD